MNCLHQITNGTSFSLKLKSNIPYRLRRLPRGMRCAVDMWDSYSKYTIDNERTTDHFLLFTSEGEERNWWINVETKEVCYDASGSLQNYTECDSIDIFDFTFYPAINDRIPSQ